MFSIVKSSHPAINLYGNENQREEDEFAASPIMDLSTSINSGHGEHRDRISPRSYGDSSAGSEANGTNGTNNHGSLDYEQVRALSKLPPNTAINYRHQWDGRNGQAMPSNHTNGTSGQQGDTLSPLGEHIPASNNSAFTVNGDSTPSTLVLAALKKRKRKPQPIPDECKDSAYYERRKRNNESAKRSREMRRIKEQQTTMRVIYLEQENLRLKTETDMLRGELEKLREIMYNRSSFGPNGV